MRLARIFVITLPLAALLPAQPQNFDNVEIDVLPVQGNVYAVFGAGGNVTVQVGRDGILLVDTSYAPLAPRIMGEIAKLNKGPLRFIINTHVHPDHTGGNEAFAKMVRPDSAEPLSIIAHENVLNRMTQPVTGNQTPPAQLGLPVDEYFTKFKDLHFNGEAVIIYHEPNAHTDGDSVILFRGSDVVATGDIFSPDSYPFIDIDRGGSVQGEIDALNHILELTVPAHTQEGGTYVVPGHGHICDEADVVEYRDMVVIVRDRIQDLIAKGRTLEQIKASKPSLDYDGRYSSATSFVKPDQFIEAVYRSLTRK
jgi:glyoxylase-like metal-dependent hydrolase (beta-lactamase superfamily II)